MGDTGKLMTAQRTYWHLANLKRKPTDYDITTSKLLYYVERGLEVETPVGEWLARYQRGSKLRCRDWECFADPRRTTYAKYVELQSAKEIFVEGLFRSIEGTDYDQLLSPEWVALLSQVVAPLRFPVHGLQMVAAYFGHMAPSGRIAVASLFQAADEMRRIQTIAYRMRLLQRSHPTFGAASKAAWQDAPEWQPLRELVERLLVAYDWGESLVALNLVVKPAFDELFVQRLARLAERRGDHTLAKVLFSLGEDCAWHREWTEAFTKAAIDDTAENRAVIDEWAARWRPLTDRALAPLGTLLES